MLRDGRLGRIVQEKWAERQKHLDKPKDPVQLIMLTKAMPDLIAKAIGESCLRYLKREGKFSGKS